MRYLVKTKNCVGKLIIEEHKKEEYKKMMGWTEKEFQNNTRIIR